MYDAITDFAFENEVPNLPPILSGYFSLIQPNIEASARRYEAALNNGLKGGRPPKKNQN